MVVEVPILARQITNIRAQRDDSATGTQASPSLHQGITKVALGPNIRYLPGEYWDFYDHYLALTELSLGEVLTETGFTLEEQIPRFLPYTMSRGGQPPVWMLRLYLKLKFAWPLFGKQFLVVAKK